MSKKREKDENHLGFGRLMAWKSSDIAAGWINVIVLNQLSFYASNFLGLDIKLVGTLLLASKIVDGFTDIFAGWLVDNTHTKLGKGRPYELGIIGMTICTVLLFSCNAQWSQFAKCVWIFAMYTFVFSIFSTLRTAAGNPYTIRHFSNNSVLIRKVASYGGIVTMGGSMILSIAFPMLMAKIATDAAGWTRLVAIVMVPATLFGVLRFLLCKEDPAVDASSKQEPVKFKEIFQLFAKNKYVWLYAIIMLAYNVITNLAVGSYYFQYIVGDLSKMGFLSVVSIVLLPIMLSFPAIMKKFGSMGKMIAVFCIVGIVGYVITFIGGGNLITTYGGYVLGNFATLPIAYYGVLFIMDICTYNEMIGLQRMEGSSNILSSFASKFGAAFGAWITGIVLSMGGYISSTDNVEQPVSALMAIRVDFALIPGILLVVIALCCLAFSRLEPRVEEFEAAKKQESL